MKNILIFSGGTGSIALQNSIAEHYGNNVNVDIIISAYDNGKSTGECRKAFNSNILGPSDLRKNHITQYKIQKDIRNEKHKSILKYFEYRFDAKNYKVAYDIVYDETLKMKNIFNDHQYQTIEMLINKFFFNDNKEYRSELFYLNFNDFSISNILYSSAAFINNNSLSRAGKYMAKLLDIKDNVHLISDTNVYLYGVTKNNYLITDEAEIVDWKRSDDEIIDVKLLTKWGEEFIPKVDEDNLTTECTDLILNSDIIIFSSGTQWSSLIPTYMHKGFNNLIKQSNAKKYIIMNNIPDKDMYGIDAFKLLKIVNNYVDLSDFIGVFNTNADKTMKLTSEIIESKILNNYIDAELSEINNKTHNDKIFKYIMFDYYKDYLNKKYFIFDFDDTIWSRNPEFNNVSISNVKMINYLHKISIVSGNSINKFKDSLYTINRINNSVEEYKCFSEIMCNGGNSVYVLNSDKKTFSYIKNYLSEFNISNTLELIQFIINVDLQKNIANVNISKFENRGNCVLSIKPIVDDKQRKLLTSILNEEFKKSDKFNNYIAIATGRTTIDIMHKDYTKGKIVNELIKNHNIDECLYIGDEILSGNDNSVKIESNIDYINVKDVFDTNSLLTTILLH